MKKYWRRSSRWRAAVKRTRPSELNYWRLQVLAENLNPFGGFAWIDLIGYNESVRLENSHLRLLAKPSPWVKLMQKGRFGARMGIVKSEIAFA